MLCSKCGKESEGPMFCSSCGERLKAAPVAKKDDLYAQMGLVFALFSFLITYFVMNSFGCLVAAIALFLSANGLKSPSSRGLAITGIVISVIGMMFAFLRILVQNRW